jgi:hypothetical protein
MAKSGPGHCQVCKSPARHQIEIGLANGMSFKALGHKFGIHHDAIGRHAHVHLTAQMRAAILVAQAPSAVDLEQLRKSESEGLLSSLVVQRARLLTCVDLALGLGDVGAAVSAEKGITAALSMSAKLLGMLTTTIDVRHTSLLVSPDYLKLRQVLVQALRSHPEALRDVSAALHRLESDAARDITAKASKPEPALIEHAPAREVAPSPGKRTGKPRKPKSPDGLNGQMDMHLESTPICTPVPPPPLPPVPPCPLPPVPPPPPPKC